MTWQPLSLNFLGRQYFIVEKQKHCDPLTPLQISMALMMTFDAKAFSRLLPKHRNILKLHPLPSIGIFGLHYSLTLLYWVFVTDYKSYFFKRVGSSTT